MSYPAFLSKMMVGEILENGLDGELDDKLGYTKYDYRNKEGKNSRNGYSKKMLKQVLIKRKSKYRETETVNLSRSLQRKIKQLSNIRRRSEP